MFFLLLRYRSTLKWVCLYKSNDYYNFVVVSVTRRLVRVPVKFFFEWKWMFDMMRAASVFFVSLTLSKNYLFCLTEKLLYLFTFNILTYIFYFTNQFFSYFFRLIKVICVFFSQCVLTYILNFNLFNFLKPFLQKILKIQFFCIFYIL